MEAEDRQKDAQEGASRCNDSDSSQQNDGITCTSLGPACEDLGSKSMSVDAHRERGSLRRRHVRTRMGSCCKTSLTQSPWSVIISDDKQRSVAFVRAQTSSEYYDGLGGYACVYDVSIASEEYIERLGFS